MMLDALLVLQVAVLLTYQESRYAKHGRDVPRQPGDWSQPLLLFSFVAAILSCLYTLTLGWGYDAGLHRQLWGEGLFLSGFAIRLHAIRTLGRHFTGHVVTREDQPLIQDGLYRWVRHPSYTGAVLELLGCALLSGSVIALGFTVLGYVPGTLYRIRLEERLLAKRFGTAFAEYAGRTKALIPFVL